MQARGFCRAAPFALTNGTNTHTYIHTVKVFSTESSSSSVHTIHTYIHTYHTYHTYILLPAAKHSESECEGLLATGSRRAVPDSRRRRILALAREPQIVATHGRSQRSQKQPVSHRNTQADNDMPSLIHTYIHTYIHVQQPRRTIVRFPCMHTCIHTNTIGANGTALHGDGIPVWAGRREVEAVHGGAAHQHRAAAGRGPACPRVRCSPPHIHTFIDINR